MPDNIAGRQNLSSVKVSEALSTIVDTWQREGVQNVGGFGWRLREARKAKRLTGTALGELADCSESAISRWESGSRVNPNAAVVERLASVLCVSPAWLLTGAGQRDAAGAGKPDAWGLAALELVLRDYDYPDTLPSDVIDGIERDLVAESKADAGARRSPAAWRRRIAELIHERSSGTRRKVR